MFPRKGGIIIEQNSPENRKYWESASLGSAHRMMMVELPLLAQLKPFPMLMYCDQIQSTEKYQNCLHATAGSAKCA